MNELTVFPCVDHIATPYTGILLDAYGVFWGGNGILHGAKEAMERLAASGKVIGILSNTTQMGVKETDRLRSHGIFEGIHFHFIVTSGDIARTLFKEGKLPFETPRRKYWLLGDEHPRFSSHRALFEDTEYMQTDDLHDADFIYLSIPHINGEDQTDPSLFMEGLDKLEGIKVPMVCTNPDKFAHEGTPPRPVVRQGTIASMHEQRGGSVFYIGKPSTLMYEAAKEQFIKHKIGDSSDILMVGDTPETDIRGAHACGISAALTTKTGIFAERVAREGLDHAIKGLSVLDTPDFYIEALGHL